MLNDMRHEIHKLDQNNNSLTDLRLLFFITPYTRLSKRIL